MNKDIDVITKKVLEMSERGFDIDKLEYLDVKDYPEEYKGLITAFNKLLEAGEKHIKQQINNLEISHSLIADYVEIFYVNFDTGRCERYKAADRLQDKIAENIQFKEGYQSAIEKYISLFVAEKDQEYVRRMTEKSYVLEELQTKGKYYVRHRVKKNLQQVEHFEIFFARPAQASSDNAVIMGFCNVDSIMQKEERYKQETMQDIEEVLAGSRTGIWTIELEDGCEPRMYGDKTMQILLGANGAETPEECYKLWFENIEPEYVGIVQETVQEIIETGRSEVTYPWNHPTMGKIYVRCGGLTGKFEKSGVRIKGYHQDITETVVTKQKQDQVILEALVEAKRANQAKSEFLSHMSHDIRTPINGILGMLAIADKNQNDVEKQRECREKIRVSAEHLLSLINDVLDISKLESGAFSFAEETFDIGDVLDNCISILRPQAEEQGIHLEERKINLCHTNLVGSPLHLRQILINIIGNALKYNQPRGKIFVSTEELASEEGVATYQFIVRDTGIGMSEDFLKCIFEPFTQENDDARTSFKGAGLGMSITKKLVDQMGGTIEVESRLGEGSTFKVVLPIKLNTEQGRQTVEREEDTPVNISGMKVLLVEDNAINYEIVKYMLEDAGAVVEIAENGKVAVDAFAASEYHAFDCILMDVMMPVMNGLDATRAIRSLDRPDAESVPIIALSANAFEEDVVKAKEAGINEHLTKPVNMERLFKVMWRLRNK